MSIFNTMKLALAKKGRPLEINQCPDPANQMFFLLGLPKSAGNALRAALDQCFTNRSRPEGIPASMQCPNGLHVELPITAAVLKDFPIGGWYHTHAQATLPTLDFLSTFNIRHIILVRHPLDQLTAYLRHAIKHAQMGLPQVAHWRPSTAITIPQSPVHAAALGAETSQEDAYQALIDQGYLYACLTWIGQWLCFRDRNLSVVLTYEHLVANPTKEIQALIDFLTPMLANPPEGLTKALNSMTAYADRSFTSAPNNIYQAGYTGKVGTYRDYLTAAHVASAERVFSEFLKHSPYGSSLATIYPEIT